MRRKAAYVRRCRQQAGSFACMLAVACALLAGCGEAGSSSGEDASRIPETTSVADRMEAMQKELAEPAKRAPGEITITFRLRPQFVLHLDGALKVASFEPLNREAGLLKVQSRKGWKNRRYSRAVRNIMEQAVIDGYISDNNPLIEVLAEQEPVAGTEAGAATRSGEEAVDPSEDVYPDIPEEVISVDLKDIEKNVLDEVNGVVEIHGISAEIEVAEDVE